MYFSCLLKGSLLRATKETIRNSTNIQYKEKHILKHKFVQVVTPLEIFIGFPSNRKKSPLTTKYPRQRNYWTKSMAFINKITLLLLLGIIVFGNSIKTKRSINLSASHALIPDVRLSRDVLPGGYEIDIRPNIEDSSFSGYVKINVSWTVPIRKIYLHAHYDLEINERSLKLIRKTWDLGMKDPNIENIPITRGDRLPKKTVYIVYLRNTVKECACCEISMHFEGAIWKTNDGLFKGSYTGVDGNELAYLATYMRPNNARRLFPCFDEPEYKVPFIVRIARPRNFVTLFNTPLYRTEELELTKRNSNYVLDHFEITPPMSTFTFGFVISQLEKFYPPDHVSNNNQLNIQINLWASKNVHPELEEVYTKLTTTFNHLEQYFNVSLPLSKIDVIAIKGLPLIHSADNWGLLIFKERDLLKASYYNLAQELIYQWLGSWITPKWWDDEHVNKALTGFLAADTVYKIDNGVEFNGKYPMTILYSLYYEFSKRYPHSRITGMKQETTSYKTELVIRMLNFTLGENIFCAAIRNFIAERHFGTFHGDDLWNALNKQYMLGNTLQSQYDIANIAGSWIIKDRLPVINVQRNYEEKTAIITQKVYLRERPHDVPERDKMIWWIPLVTVEENNLNFSITKPKEWMDKKSHVMREMPGDDKFIIVNPEEIGPFPVNYDKQNWNLLSSFLQKKERLNTIPTYTRAKLLHDAWNLAYAGDLSFATAFNMTLFMKIERNHLVWNPVFTFIDHIGRHIDMSDVHEKFEAYVRYILTPLYLELTHSENTEIWETDLKSMAETFLCRAGYKSCIEEAQHAFKLWMQSDKPDEKLVVPNKFICPVFKWGTIEEWQFGLMRVINFPKSRLQSERTFLLKNLVGCPVHSEKVTQLLNVVIIERNSNFTENDIFLIFNMLSGGSCGYKALFNFLYNNWSIIKQRFENKTNLWDSLIGSATGMFTTEDGYRMVKNLYDEHKEEFASALHIIEKSMRNIKEEAKWSDENLPIIENWLTEFLNKNNK